MTSLEDTVNGLADLGYRITNLENIVNNDHGPRISALEATIGQQQSLIEQLQAVANAQGQLIDSLIEMTADNATVQDLLNRVAALESALDNWSDPDSNPAPSIIEDDSLVLYLPLHQLEGTSFPSADAYHYPITVNGAEKTQYGRSFDGINDSITVGNAPQLNFGTGDFTIIFWDAWDGSEGCLLKRYNPSRGYFLIMGGSGRPTLTLRANTPTYTFRSAAHTRSPNEWAYSAFTVDRSTNTITAFANGVLSQNGQIIVGDFNPSSNIGSSQNFYLGRQWLSGEPYYGGQIGDVLIYNRVLTPDEIEQNYLATKSRYE